MATVDATDTGTAHGTLTPNTAEVINFGHTAAGRVEVMNRGDTVMYGLYGATDLTIAGEGTEAIPAGGIVTFYGESGVAGSICLKSTAAVDYSVSKFDVPREGGGGGGGGASGEVELGATSLAALESITIVDGGSTISVDDGAGSLTVDGTVAATQSGTWTVQPGNTANTTAWKVDGSAVTQPVSGTVTANAGTVATATLANVSGSATSVTLFASNAAARGRTIHNDSTATLYLKFGATASTTSYTVKLDSDAYYEFPSPLYTGVVDGIWSSATGAGRTTEVA